MIKKLIVISAQICKKELPSHVAELRQDSDCLGGTDERVSIGRLPFRRAAEPAQT